MFVCYWSMEKIYSMCNMEGYMTRYLANLRFGTPTHTHIYIYTYTPIYRLFSHKNPKMFDFRFNTLISSLNQGQGSVFKAINSPHKFTPRGSFVKKFSTRPCFRLHPEDNPHYNKRLIIRH
jgi:hypothetical protein